MALARLSRAAGACLARPAGRFVLLAGLAGMLAACMQQPVQPELPSQPQPRAQTPAAPAEAGVTVDVQLPDMDLEPAPSPAVEKIEVRADPLERREAPPPLRNDVVVLLPHADGSAGTVVVKHEDGEIVLDRAYAAALITGPGQARSFVYEPEQASRVFSAALAALPPRPKSFLVYFDLASDELSAESQRQIEQLFAGLSARPVPEITVTGHTDTMGSTEFNDRLSLQRARTIRDELVRRGIARELISVSGRGKRELLVPTEDQVAEPRNRRVEIEIR
jgi:outer membrane protein OmpA-like peptidoglycan-associated protein